MHLNTTFLQNAVLRLEEGLARYTLDESDSQIRDGLIQRFEFSYELSHKTLKRYLAQASANPSELDAMPFADLIRTANEHGLLAGDWPAWRVYRDMRNKTSHTYDESVALEVVRGIPAFLHEAKALLAALQIATGR